MERYIGYISIVLVLLIAPIPALSSDTDTLISGFQGIQWGSTVSKVVKKMGTPSSTSEDTMFLATTQKRLLYKKNSIIVDEDAVLSDRQVIIFIVDSNFGLVKGTKWIYLTSDFRCERLFNYVKQSIQSHYPGLGIYEEKKYSEPWIHNFCTGVDRNRALWYVFWKQTTNNVSISQRLKPGTNYVTLTYEHPRYLKRIRSKNWGRRGSQK